MYGRKQLPLGCSLFVAVVVFGMFLFLSLLNLYLFWDGVITQGAIVGEEICSSKGYTKYSFTVEFTDQTGQVNFGTISQCLYPSFYASPGNSVTIVYAPIDPAIIAPLDSLIGTTLFLLFVALLFGLISLILFLSWRSKQKQNTYDV